MRALLLEPDPAWLEERRRRGIDRRDEVWEGVLHVVPPSRSRHDLFERDLADVLKRIAKPLGLEVVEQFAVYAHERNYRKPDIVVVHPDDIREIGCIRAEVVVEVLSPHDESREKFAFYAAQGVGELWLVDPATRASEVYVLRNATYFAVLPNRAGLIEAPRFGLELSIVDGPKLRVAWDGGSADV